MEPETNNETLTQEVKEKSTLHTVTPLSKYLAMALFIILPFVGGWIGYHYAPEKIVEVEKVIEVEKVTVNKDTNDDVLGEVTNVAEGNENIDVSDWVIFSNSDGVYQIEHPSSWEVETEMFYNYERFKLINASYDGYETIFSIGFISNPRYTDKFGDVGGRPAMYGEFDSCIGEAQTRAGGPDCILTIVNIPLTVQETAEVRTDTSTGDEWFIEVTLGVSTEEFFVSRDKEVYLNLADYYQEQESLLKEVLNSLEFIKNTAQ